MNVIRRWKGTDNINSTWLHRGGFYSGVAVMYFYKKMKSLRGKSFVFFLHLLHVTDEDKMKFVLYGWMNYERYIK